MGIKNTLLSFARRAGFMHWVEKLHFTYHKLKARRQNKKFIYSHPNLPLPPHYMLYESYRINYEMYFTDGYNTAKWILSQLKRYIHFDKANILDWGCGPARVVRHLPQLLKDTATSVYGTDYNEQTIDWCKKNISGVSFNLNAIHPPLNYADSFFDIVYGISIFTHLSLENHNSWMDELHRITKPGGIILLTTQGQASKIKLSEKEKKLFDAGHLVIRSNEKEGHRIFSAFQPPPFMKKIFSEKWQTLKHTEGGIQNGEPQQDTWIIQKV